MPDVREFIFRIDDEEAQLIRDGLVLLQPDDPIAAVKRDELIGQLDRALHEEQADARPPS